MRKSWVQDPKTGKLIPKEEYVPERAKTHMIMPDIEDFVSPVTKEVIGSRSTLRKHMKEHNLAHMDDFKNHWEKRSQEMRNHTRSKEERASRIEALKHAMEKNRG